jgi:hypothetical protein
MDLSILQNYYLKIMQKLYPVKVKGLTVVLLNLMMHRLLYAMNAQTEQINR